MAISAADLKKYGLSKSDATAADHDAGIVQVKGNFYSINDFERQQSEGIDTDQGATFGTSLEKDSGKDFTNFNTATDVEGALQSLYGGKGSKKEDEPVVHSAHLAHARARSQQRVQDRVSGQIGRDLYGGGVQDGNSFLDRYVLNLGEKLENGYYVKSDGAATNDSQVAAQANSQSLDVPTFAKHGIDNRFGV